MPPPPDEQAIGSEGEQIDPNGELASDSEGGESGEAGENSEQAQQSKRKGSQAQSGQQQDQNSESDGQAMPEDIGGSSGSKRGKGTIDDVAVPSNL